MALERAQVGSYSMPGDTAQLRRERERTPEGAEYDVLEDPEVKPRPAASFQVPDDAYFMLGDNRDNSRDSRFWRNTFVPRDDILGRVVRRHWSYDPETWMPRVKRIGKL